MENILEEKEKDFEDFKSEINRVNALLNEKVEELNDL